MKKSGLLVYLILLLNFSITAQETEEVLKEIYLDAEFFLAREEYSDALPEYVKLLKRGYDNSNINYRIGICYLNIEGRKAEAIAPLKKAIENLTPNYVEGVLKETKAPYDAYIFLGNAYRINNQLDSAIGAYTRYKDLFNSTDYLNINYANQQIEACMIAKRMIAMPIDIETYNLGITINNKSDNFNPAVSGDMNSMVYMTKLPFYDAVYYSTYKNGAWKRPLNITPEIQSDGDQYSSSLSYDGKTLFLTKEDEFESNIYVSYLQDNGEWSKSKKMDKPVNSKFWESHAVLSPDGKNLYFTSNRNGGQGEMDIWVSEKQKDGNWSNPKNLGPNINTEFNEDTPFLTPDGKMLFFSSQGHFNSGGYDIFYSYLNADSTWSEPRNVGYPVSTTDDDLFYVPMDNQSGFFARYYTSGYGSEDIYGLKITPRFDTPEEEIADEDYFKPPVVVNIEDTTTIIAQVAEDAPAIESTEKAPEKGEKILIKETRFELFTIYFDFDKATMPLESKNRLLALKDLLVENPGVSIKLSGYADAMGPNYYNLFLSEQRAQEVKNYLVSLGVKSSRITVEGKGKVNYKAINTNPDGTDNPEGRKFNRRVEIELINAGTNIVVTKVDDIPESLKIKL